MGAIKTNISDVYRKNTLFFFVGAVALIVILFYIIYQNRWAEAYVFNPLAHLYAAISGLLIQVLGYDVQVSGDQIYSNAFSISVKKGCDAAEPMAIFIAGILSFPASARKKFTGLLIGLSVLFILNIVRVLTLFLTGIYLPDLFEALHIAVWQVVFIIVAILLWFLWLRKVVHKTEKNDERT